MSADLKAPAMVHTFLREDVDVLYPQSNHPTYQLGVRFRYRGRNHTLGLSPQGTPGRQVYQGPMVDALFGWLNEEASVIARVHIADPRPVYHLSMGDVIVIEGYGSFVLTPPDYWRSYDAPCLRAFPWPAT